MSKRSLLVASLGILALVGCSASADDATTAQEEDLNSLKLTPTVIALPGGGLGTGGIGIDDMGFAPGLNRVVVPAGRTGNVDLVDIDTLEVKSVAGFSVEKQFHGSHDFGATSVTEANGLLFVADRTTNTMRTVDPKKGALVGSAVKFAASPDYVRSVPALHEIWVSEPDKQQIEIFSIPKGATTPVHTGVVAIDGDGPESLVIDHARGRAYTNLFSNVTLAIDLKSHKIVDRFTNACAKDGTDPNDRGSRGIAVDEARGFLIVGCAEGIASVVDITVPGGKRLSQVKLPGTDVDVLAFDPVLGHLYATPGERLAILGLSDHGVIKVIGTTPIPTQARSVVADGKGFVYVGDQKGSGLLRFQDPLPASH